jgi:hypothetical protein
MSIVHRVVIMSSVLSAAGMWFLLRGMSEVSGTQTALFMLLPGASVATACYCVCMVFNCMGRR